MNNRILTFGDSHSTHFPEYAILHHIGPVLAYSVGVKGFDVLDLSKYEILSGDNLIFSFGEIDCRCHISKYHDRNNDETFRSSIDSIVEKYLYVVKQNIDRLENKPNSIWIYNIVPPIRKSRHNAEEEDGEPQPLRGSDEERKSYTLYMNQKLRYKASEYGWFFLDIYDKYKDEDGFLIYDLSDGCMHINNYKYIDDFIKENII
jgi:hypothetical protein